MRLAATIQIHAGKEIGRPLFHHPKNQNTVAVDFDGVLNSSSGPYAKDHFGEPLPEGFALLKMLREKGFDVVVLTARKETDMVAKWLADHGFPNMFVTREKLPALAYIDDRAIHFHKNSTARDIIHQVIKRPER